MAFKAVLLCASALLVQSISAQCIGNPVGLGGNIGLAGNGLAGYGLAGNGLAGYGLPNNGLANNGLAGLSSGGGFVVTSSSPIAPTGLSVLADNLVIEGPVAVGGQLPLLGAVALEGQLPTGGQASISYGCGNGNVGIVGEVGGPAGLGYGPGVVGPLAGPGLVGPGLAGPGLVGPGLAGVGLAGVGGCNRLY